MSAESAHISQLLPVPFTKPPVLRAVYKYQPMGSTMVSFPWWRFLDVAAMRFPVLLTFSGFP